MTEPQQPSGTPVTIRRAPRYKVFLATGAVVGLGLGVVAGLLAATSPEYSRGTLVGYLAVALAGIGTLVGGLIAVFSERSRRQ